MTCAPTRPTLAKAAGAELAKKNVAYAEQQFQRQAELVQRDFASGQYEEAQDNLEVAHQQVAVAGAGAPRPAR